MENSVSTINRVGRAMWTVWGYLSGAVGRYLSPVTTEGNQHVHFKQENNKEEEVKHEITVKEGHQRSGVSVRAAAVQWEKGNAGADPGKDEENAIFNTGVKERPKKIFPKAQRERDAVDNDAVDSDAIMKNNASTTRDDLACTDTDINNYFRLSKSQEDQADKKESKTSQEISSKTENENVENIFKTSSSRKITLACTDTDINKDDLSETKVDLPDGKRSNNNLEKSSRIAKKKEDLENLFKEYKEQDTKEGLGVTTVIQKVLVEKTEKHVDDQCKKEDTQRKIEEADVAITSQMQMVDKSSLSQLVEDLSSKNFKMDVSDHVGNICKHLETTQMEDAETNQNKPDTLNEEILGNNDTKYSNLPSVELKQSDPHIEHMKAGTRLVTDSDISGLQRPNIETIMTEQDVKRVVAKVKAETGNQNDTCENESEFKARVVTEDMMKPSLQKQDRVDESMINQQKEKAQTDDCQTNECSLKVPLSLEQNVTPLDLESIGEMASSSLQELDRTDETKPIVKIKKAKPTKQKDETYTISEEKAEISSDDELNHSPVETEFSVHLGVPVHEALTPSDTETNTKKHKILDKTNLQFTDKENVICDSLEVDMKNAELETSSTYEMDQCFCEQGSLKVKSAASSDSSISVPGLYISSEANETSVCSIAKQLAKSKNNSQSTEPHNEVRVMSEINDNLEHEHDKSGLERKTKHLATELTESTSMVFDDISKTLLEDQVNNGKETLPDISAVRLTCQIKTSDILVFSETESTLEVLERPMNTETDIEEDRPDKTVSLAEGVVEKVIHEKMKKSEEDSISKEKEMTPIDVQQEELYQSYKNKELPVQGVNDSSLTATFSKIAVHLEPQITDITLQEQDKSQCINKANVDSLNTLTPETQTIRTKHALNNQSSQQEESFEAVDGTFEVTTESAKDQPKIMDSKDMSETVLEDGCNCSEPVKDESAVETESVGLHIETVRSLSLSESESTLEVIQTQKDSDQKIEKCERIDSFETELKTIALEVVEQILRGLIKEPEDPEEVAEQESIGQSYIKEDSMQEHLLDQEVTKSFMNESSTKVKPVLPELKENLTQELDKMECAYGTSVESTKHNQAEITFEVPTELVEVKALILEDTFDTLVVDHTNRVECIQDKLAVETELHRPQMDKQIDTEQLKTTSLEVVDKIMRELIKESIDMEEVPGQKVIGQSYPKEESVQENVVSKEVTKSLMKASSTKVPSLIPMLEDDSANFSIQEMDKIKCANEISVGSSEQTAKVTSISKHEQAESKIVETTFEIPTELFKAKTTILDDTSATPLEDRRNNVECIQDKSAFETELHGPLMDVITGLIEASDKEMKKAKFETIVEEPIAHQEMSKQHHEEISADTFGNEFDSKCHPREYESDTNIICESSHETVEKGFKVPNESVPGCKPAKALVCDYKCKIVFEDQPNKTYELQPECLGPVKVSENESSLESLKVQRDFKPETEKQDRNYGLLEKNGSVVASVRVVDELKVALKKKSKTCKMEASGTEEMFKFEKHVEDRLSEIIQDETMDITCKNQKINALRTMKDDFPEIEKAMHKKEERSRPELKRGIKDIAGGKKIPSSVFLSQQISFLDFTAQKSKIALRSPLVRPPKDPRMLINMASVDPLTLALPSQPSTLQRPVKEDASTPSKNLIGFKLPGLGAGLPALRKTEAGKKIKDEEDTQVHTERSNAESQPTDECVQQKPVSDKPAKPKWTPPKHPGMGSPMMMAELKNKLKKNVKE